VVLSTPVLGAQPAQNAQRPAAQAARPNAQAAPQSEVQQLANRWTAAYNRRDGAGLANLYTTTAKLFAHGSPTVSGRPAIQSYWADDMRVNNPLTVLRVTHSVDGIDMKLVHGDYQVLNRDTGVPLGGGRFAHIWVREADGQWRLDRDLWNQPYDLPIGIYAPR
jgi:uncharacterized protein (TIGR02246 family)